MKLSVALWEDIVELSEKIQCNDKAIEQYIKTSSLYGLWLHRIMEQGWIVMLKGYQGEQTGVYDKTAIKLALEKYDHSWNEYRQLKENNGDCATLYYDQYVKFNVGGDRTKIGFVDGMGATVNKYRAMVE